MRKTSKFEGYFFDVQINFICAAIVCLSVSLVRAGSIPATPPDQQDGMKVLRSLAEHERMELSTAPTSAAEKFYFNLVINTATPSGGHDGFIATVVREGPKAGIILSSPDNFAYAYMTNGLLVAVDRDNPGGLVVKLVGAPDFFLGEDNEKHEISMHLEFGAKLTEPLVRLNIGAILGGFLKAAREASVTPDRRMLSFSTEHSQVEIALLIPDQPVSAPLPLRDLIVASRNMRFGMVLGAERECPLEVFAVSRETVEQLGIPVRQLGKREHLDLPFSSNWTADKKMLFASAMLQTLFPRRSEIRGTDGPVNPSVDPYLVGVFPRFEAAFADVTSSDAQKDQFRELMVRTRNDCDALRKLIAARTVARVTVSQRLAAINARLVLEVQQILGEDAYKSFAKALEARKSGPGSTP